MSEQYVKWDTQRKANWPKAQHDEFQSWDAFVVVAKYAEGGDWVARNLAREYELNRHVAQPGSEQRSYIPKVEGSNPSMPTNPDRGYVCQEE